MRDAELHQRVGDRGACSARAEHHHRVGRGAGHRVAKTLGETPAVGVVALAFPSRNTTVFTAPIRARVGRELAEQRNDGLLEGMRDVEALEARLPRRVDKLAQRRIGQTEPVEVEKQIGIVDAEAPRLPLMHAGAARRLDAAADEPDQNPLAAVPRHAHMLGRKAAESVDKSVDHIPISSHGRPACLSPPTMVRALDGQ